MAGQSRTAQTRRSRTGSGSSFLRGAFIMIVALAVSFFIGFAVIARMIPSDTANKKDTSGLKQPGDAPQPAATAPSGGASNHNAATRTPPVQTAKKPETGPSILPDDEVQKPNSVDGGTDATNKPEPGAGTSADDSGDNGATSRTGAGSGPAAQPATSPDGNKPPASGQEAAPVTPPKGVYRVQFGVYSTRARAEEIVASATDKGIAAKIRVITRDGRTLYRVQHSTHKDRAAAEAEKQKLIDEGFDASIINPS